MGDMTPIARPCPFVLIVSHSLSGHLHPMIRISAGLSHRNWPVSFLGPTAHRSRIESTGAQFFPLTGKADLDDKRYYEDPPTAEYNSLHWVERGKIDLRIQLLESLPDQWADFKRVLRTLHERDPARRVLVISEAFFMGVLPMKYGASLGEDIEVPKTICISVTVPVLRSVDLPPFAWPLPFDQSPAGRERNARMWEKWTERARPFTELLDSQLFACSASRGVGEPFLAGANYRCHDAILQLGVPGFEYPRSDFPANFKFAGLVQGVPNKSTTTTDPDFEWWSELKANSELAVGHPKQKKVVVVAQGTVEINPNDLIIPTIKALADREDVLVVAILGWKDAKLSDFVKVPSNARIADYLSYDAVLEHADVWAHNAGFGAVNHGIAHGVPMVVAGEGMDKTENSRRVAWSGIGVDLGSAKPSIDDVRRGIESVLQDERYSLRVEVLKKQSQEINCFDVVDEELLKFIEP
ncbi:uncharacterized protein BCR38DRAFT_481673 [Pseudomassariella vexata]|uniref:Erythromycin biosynthesis protein CIII-like C-terminal domain-containing protein n=1 Tax=Pseudomassariella vexata TaxID=1141098 RepID=A0A1Y2E9W6_9PEZI|nr:uncharacterized protein BCR38DRAFT_481673 [Pseudomassariella vexata]ORY68187.1 hypothetical protein BCR38DRAFT_481673 [Pseudomassariella vexata]